MKRAEDGTTPITSKSRVDDVVEVLLYIAFAYFDWARHTELFNDANAAPADGRYKEAIRFLQQAVAKNSKRDIVLKYNVCMTKLQAANCILQKLTRNIPRTVDEVQGALDGLNESLLVVEGILKDKGEGKKVVIATSTLNDFIKHCRANISSAESHLEDEKKRAEEAEAEKELRRLAAEAALKEEELRKKLEQAEQVKAQEERDRKAEAKMKFVEEKQIEWKQQQEREAARKEAAKIKPSKNDDFIVDDPPPDQEFEEEDNQLSRTNKLFDESDNEGDGDQKKQNGADKKVSKQTARKVKETDLFGDSDEEDDDEGQEDAPGAAGSDKKKESSAKPAEQHNPSGHDLFDDSSDDNEQQKTTTSAKAPDKQQPSSNDLFEDSSDDSDEELVSEKKRGADTAGEEGPAKKQRVLQEDDED